jgi:hypothetical protein
MASAARHAAEVAGGQRRARLVDGRAAEQRLAQREGVAELGGDRLQDPHALGGDLGTDAVAGQNYDGGLHGRLL